ncbi:MAG: amidohydrolase family protein [Acidobacteria bacterium]|nr:amidohydrolase family protein [Acidobacteriota bacterium]
MRDRKVQKTHLLMGKICKMGSLSLLGILLLLSFLPIGHGQDLASLQKKLDMLNAYPDLIVFNGKIATMDPSMTTVQAMAIRNRRLVALGTNDDVKFLAGPKTEMLDVKGRTVLPGLIEVHDHAHTFAELHRLTDGSLVAKYGPEAQMTFARSATVDGMVKAVEAEVKKRANELGPGKWVIVAMWSGRDSSQPRDVTGPATWASPASLDLYETRAIARAVIGRGLISLASLDKVAPDNPVLVRAAGQVPVSIYNSRAVQIVRERMGPHGATDDGKSGGGVQEYFLFDILLKGKTEAVADVLKMEMENCLAPYGITSLRTRMASPAVMKAANWLDHRNDLAVRWAWINSIGFSFAENVVDFYKLFPDFRGHGSEYLWYIASSSEGDPFRCTQAGKPRDPNRNPADLYTEPCNADPEHVDYATSEQWKRLQGLIERGIRVDQMHGQTDGAYDSMFFMIEKAIREGKITEQEIRDMRIGLEHNAITRPDQKAKLEKYNIYLTLQPFHYFRDTLQFVRDYGEQYLTWGQAAKDFTDTKVKFTINTAYHLTKGKPEQIGQPAPASFQNNSIWPHLDFYVTREVDGKTYLPEQAIDRVQVISAITRTPSELMLRENELGSLEVGKLADFIVIDKDYFSIPANQIRTITTLLTVVGGKVTYRNARF